MLFDSMLIISIFGLLLLVNSTVIVYNHITERSNKDLLGLWLRNWYSRGYTPKLVLRSELKETLKNALHTSQPNLFISKGSFDQSKYSNTTLVNNLIIYGGNSEIIEKVQNLNRVMLSDFQLFKSESLNHLIVNADLKKLNAGKIIQILNPSQLANPFNRKEGIEYRNGFDKILLFQSDQSNSKRFLLLQNPFIVAITRSAQGSSPLPDNHLFTSLFGHEDLPFGFGDWPNGKIRSYLHFWLDHYHIKPIEVNDKYFNRFMEYQLGFKLENFTVFERDEYIEAIRRQSEFTPPRHGFSKHNDLDMTIYNILKERFDDEMNVINSIEKQLEKVESS